MSQRACLISVDGELIRKVFNHVPENIEDFVKILKDEGYTAETCKVGNYYLVYYDYIEIDTDENNHIDDETLLDLYQTYAFEDVVAEYFGVEVTTLDMGEYEIWFEDLKED